MLFSEILQIWHLLTIQHRMHLFKVRINCKKLVEGGQEVAHLREEAVMY
jgi:hypothetical protein